MQWLKRAVLIIVLLLVALSTIDFMLENQQSIALQFLEFSSPQLPISSSWSLPSFSAVCSAFSSAGS